MTERDPHRTLGVAAGADPAALRRAFREAALRYHPDRFGAEGTQRFQEALWAYETLLEQARCVEAAAAVEPSPRRERWPRAEPLIPAVEQPAHRAAPEPLWAAPPRRPASQALREREALLRWIYRRLGWR